MATHYNDQGTATRKCVICNYYAPYTVDATPPEWLDRAYCSVHVPKEN